MFQKISGQKLYEKVIEQIKTMIARGLYKKGDMLPSESELMQLTGVSRITVREALRILNEAGVIRTQKGKGSFVLIDYSFNELLKYDREYGERFLSATQVRLWLEPGVAAHVASTATEEDIETIGKALKGQAANGDALEQFHLQIIRSARNAALEDMFSHLADMEQPPAMVELVEPAEQKSISHKLQKQHELIYEAICRHDAEFAYFYMKEHVLYVYEQYQTYFRSVM